MPREKSAGALIFYRAKGQEPLYLLLQYPSGAKTKKEYWDFPKGHMEKGETELQTVEREVQEETGITRLFFVKGFRQTISYMFQVKNQKIFKTVVFFLAGTSKKDVTISHEHLGYVWLPFEKALAKLKFANAKKLLKKARRFLR